MGVDLASLAVFAQHLAGLGTTMLREAAMLAPEVELKPDRSFVTSLDKAIEQRLRREIVAHYPDHGIIGEEEGIERPDAALQWVLDPIDGTAPFIAGVPVYATLVALAVDMEPVIGVAEFPAASRSFVGVRGAPTLMNGAPCRTGTRTTLTGAMMACMNPDFFTGSEHAVLEALRDRTGWRIYGTSSLAYGLIAAGRIDLALDTRLQPHDFACYGPIIEGAGGVVTDWHGEPLTLASGQRVLASANEALHEQAQDRVRQALA